MYHPRFVWLTLIVFLLTACPEPPTPPPEVKVTIDPKTAAVEVGGTQTFTATVENATDKSVTWKAERGTVTDAGVYTAPATAGQDTVTVTSVEDTTESDDATVTVTPAPVPPEIESFTANPTSIEQGGSSTLSWTVTGDEPISLSIDNDVGTVTGQSVVVTPEETTEYTLTATNSAGTETASATVTVTVPQELKVEDSFSASEAGSIIGVGFDASSDTVWVFGSNLSSYTRTGTFLATIDRPGESANDADVDFLTEALTLGETSLPAGTLLFINGETGPADIYAVDKATGTVLASLEADFGVSHVVGGAYHAERNTIFLVADKLDSATPSTIAEINPQTGEVLNSFGTGSNEYTINFGDIEVSQATGNLLLLSSDETTIRELTPTGEFVQELALPTEVSSTTGIALDDTRGEAFIGGSGTVWRVSGFDSED